MRAGIRRSWDEVPSSVLAALGEQVGGALTPLGLAASGFSPGPAGPCAVNGGRTVFVKACSSTINPFTPPLLRREAAVLGVLPADAPAPALLGVVDEGEWCAIAVEHVPGRTPVAPVGPDDVDRVLDLVTAVAAIIPAAGTLDAALADERERSTLWAWRQLRTDDPAAVTGRLDPWSARHLERLVALEADWPAAVAGAALVHGDLRTDNMVLGGSTAVAVDWPAAGVGAPWLDLVGLLPSLHLDGGPAPQDAFDRHPVGVAAPPDAVDVFLAALAGYFTRQALLPPPPNMPTVRAFQAAQGEIARAWLAARTGWR